MLSTMGTVALGVLPLHCVTCRAMLDGHERGLASTGRCVAATLLLLRISSSRVEGRLLLLLLTSEHEATSVTELRSGCWLLAAGKSILRRQVLVETEMLL